ncbi:MAG: DUF2752 domain-containing protein [Phycisphaerales bacterium]
MAIALVPAPRRFGIAWPVWLVGGAWVALVAAAWFLDRARGTSTPTCLFRAVTGVPCPTCGSTRCAMRLANADIVGAWSFNPFITVVLVWVGLYLILRLGFGRRLHLGLSHRQKTLGWAVLGVLMLVNWAYVLKYHGAI